MVKRGYHWSSKAWYSNPEHPLREVAFGLYYPDGSTKGECRMTWVRHTTSAFAYAPRLEAARDALAVLGSFFDLLGEFENIDPEKDYTEADFVALLDDFEFEDLTQYERPRGIS